MANKDKIRLNNLKKEKQEELFKDLLKTQKRVQKHYLEIMTQYLYAKTDHEANEIQKQIHLVQSRSIFKKLSNEDKELYLNFYSVLYEETDLIQSYSKILENLFEFRIYWKNDIKAFKSKTNNRERQLSELVHFLFSKYKLPAFAVNVWKNITRQPHDLAWFFHIAEGNNLRKADYLPFPLTNKHIHNMYSAPDDLTFTNHKKKAPCFSYGDEFL